MDNENKKYKDQQSFSLNYQNTTSVSAFGGKILDKTGITKKKEYINKIRICTLFPENDNWILLIYREDQDGEQKGHPLYNVDGHSFNPINEKIDQIPKATLIKNEDHWFKKIPTPNPNKKIYKTIINEIEFLSYIELSDSQKRILKRMLSGKYTL